MRYFYKNEIAEAYIRLRDKVSNNLERDLKIISTNAQYSYKYAFYVIKSRFYFGEEAIKKDYFWNISYTYDVILMPIHSILYI